MYRSFYWLDFCRSHSVSLHYCTLCTPLCRIQRFHQDQSRSLSLFHKEVSCMSLHYPMFSSMIKFLHTTVTWVFNSWGIYLTPSIASMIPRSLPKPRNFSLLSTNQIVYRLQVFFPFGKALLLTIPLTQDSFLSIPNGTGILAPSLGRSACLAATFKIFAIV